MTVPGAYTAQQREYERDQKIYSREKEVPQEIYFQKEQNCNLRSGVRPKENWARAKTSFQSHYRKFPRGPRRQKIAT